MTNSVINVTIIVQKYKHFWSAPHGKKYLHLWMEVVFGNANLLFFEETANLLLFFQFAKLLRYQENKTFSFRRLKIWEP
jgi:hypothetical protein